MAFSKKDKEGSKQKHLSSLTLREIEEQLAAWARLLDFHGSGVSERTARNCRYIRMWCEMGPLEFDRRRTDAWKNSESKDINVVSGAYSKAGALIIPEDDDFKPISPSLSQVIDYQKERQDRLDYAKERQAEAQTKM